MSKAGARGLRLAAATSFVTCMAVCMVPMGCGASDEYAAVPEHRTGSLPASTVHALQVCAEEHAGRLPRRAYEIEFQVELKDDRVSEVTPKGPRLDSAGLERCMMDALRTMADAGYSPDPDALISRGGLLPARGERIGDPPGDPARPRDCRGVRYDDRRGRRSPRRGRGCFLGG